MEVVLEDIGLKEFIDQKIPKPVASNTQNLVEWKKCVTEARQLILDIVRDHIVSNIHAKETPYAMWKTFTDLYQNSSDKRKLELKEKLRKIKMEKGKTIPKCLTKFTQCHDELGSVGIMVFDDDMVSIDILGLPNSWHSYRVFVNGREKLLDWE